MSVSFILEIVAVVCLFLAAFGVSAPRVGLGWLGMALWLLALMVGGMVLR